MLEMGKNGEDGVEETEEEDETRGGGRVVYVVSTGAEAGMGSRKRLGGTAGLRQALLSWLAMFLFVPAHADLTWARLHPGPHAHLCRPPVGGSSSLNPQSVRDLFDLAPVRAPIPQTQATLCSIASIIIMST